MQLLKRFGTPVLVAFLTIFAILPLFHAGFFPMHDDEQIARLFDLDQALRAGNIPPRIAPNLGFGYGYPFFNFYPSFAYYVGELFHLLGFGYIDATKLMLAAAFILSALFMYLFVKQFFGKIGGVVAAVAYTYASYHAVDIYVRGAFAEFFSFVFIPLIFWATYKVQEKTTYRYVVIGAIAVAGLILSHNLIAFMLTPFLGVWLIYLLITSKKKKSFVLFTLLLFILGFGLSAYYWLPSYVERGFTLVNILTTELANYSIHFVCTRQLWESSWGYGGSIPSCYDGISFEIGQIQIILSVTAFILAVGFLRNKKYRNTSYIIFLFSFFLFCAVFLMTKFSRPIWDIIPPLWYVQFPWRFLLISAFIVSLLSGSIFAFIQNEKMKLVVGVILVVLLITTSFARFTPQRFFNATDEDYTNTNKIRWETSSLAYEYVPNGVAVKKSAIGTTHVDIQENEIATQAAQVVSGKMTIQVVHDLPQYKQINVEVVSPGTLQINTFSFPGWKVFIDGRKVSYTSKNKLKLIEVYLNKNSHVVEAKLSDTPIRTAGNAATLISIIVLVLGGFVFRKRITK